MGLLAVASVLGGCLAQGAEPGRPVDGRGPASEATDSDLGNADSAGVNPSSPALSTTAVRPTQAAAEEAGAVASVEARLATEAVEAAAPALPTADWPQAPELEAKAWLNSDPLTMAGLRGKVVIVDFWTFG
jgi:hypothetical protein